MPHASCLMVVLSPHFDDAALSCGGRLARAGRGALVVTICAGSPGDELSPLARQLHARMGGHADLVAQRRAEDARALERLGVATHRLDLPDSIYRRDADGWFYPSLDAVFGDVHPAEAELPAVLAEALAALPGVAPDALLLAPLGYGHHVDHLIARAAALRLHAAGRRVAFYEDFPYADPAHPHPYGARPGDPVAGFIDDLVPDVEWLSEEEMQARIESVCAYESQVPAIFGDAETAHARLRAFARWQGNGRLAERCWTFP